MRRAEAEARVNSRVKAWTAANGVYTGVLEAISGSPWRGLVRVDGVIEVAQHFERGAAVRRGFRPEERVEVGASSIRVWDPMGTASPRVFDDYLAALVAAESTARARSMGPVQGPHHWVHAAFANALLLAITAEHRRLIDGSWDLHSQR